MSGLSPEQLLLRTHKMTASSWADYLGRSPWRSPSEAWELDMGIRERVERPETWMGTQMEEAIALAAWRVLIGNSPLERPWGAADPECYLLMDVARSNVPGAVHGTWVRPAPPGACWWAVTPDRLFPDAQQGLQIKCSDARMEAAHFGGQPGCQGDFDNWVVPEYALIQCQIEMAAAEIVLGWEAKEWWLCAYFGGSRLRLYRLRRDKKLQQRLFDVGLAFWRQHLDPEGPQQRPDDRYWVKRFGAPEDEQRPRKLTGEELEAAPVPFTEPPALGVPFTEEEDHGQQ